MEYSFIYKRLNDWITIVDYEKELIARAKKGDMAAFTDIVNLHKNRIYRLCLSMMRDPVLADETAQDVFVKLFESLGKFREESKLSTWLYRVGFNVCADRHRSIKWRRWLRIDDMDLEARCTDRPDIQAELNDKLNTLWAALERLSEKHRRVLVLREIEQFEYTQIAEILNISVGTVESRLFRAREKLRIIMVKGDIDD